MSPSHELLELERAAWKALSTSGEEAAAFYEERLSDRVLMMFPGDLVIDDRDRVIESMQGPPWDSFEVTDERVLPLGHNAAVVAYKATARRDGTDYTALFNSTYVRKNGDWKLALHQQTPV
jgi:hypothetical protein